MKILLSKFSLICLSVLVLTILIKVALAQDDLNVHIFYNSEFGTESRTVLKKQHLDDSPEWDYKIDAPPLSINQVWKLLDEHAGEYMEGDWEPNQISLVRNSLTGKWFYSVEFIIDKMDSSVEVVCVFVLFQGDVVLPQKASD